ncbi:MAG: hypothetical protein IJQ73_00180 [Kiritimatiellae bacterium]|nr:hypothetical protein [Kiritimatiellia bacterium]
MNSPSPAAIRKHLAFRILLLSLCIPHPLLAQTPGAAQLPPYNLFAMPVLHPVHRQLVGQFKKAIAERDYAAMEKLSEQAVGIFPEDATWRYNLACSRARRGKPREALAELEKAVRLGFTNADDIAADTDLAVLRRDPAFARILGEARALRANPAKLPHTVKPAEVVPGKRAPVSEGNTTWNMENGGFITLFAFPPRPEKVETNDFVNVPGKTGERLRQWQLEGTAAGNWGDLYDNLDRGHSRLDLRRFPEMTPIRYCAAAVSNGLDNTGATLFNFAGAPVIGNSSTAMTAGPMWRSIPRYAQEFTAPALVAQYLNNQSYVYPQHRDYLPTIAGDVYPSRTPYLYISPGSSWTDQPILAALATALAALRPEVKADLVRRHLLAPVLRVLVHSSLHGLSRRADYLEPTSHPPILKGDAIDTLRLVESAHALTTNALPPLVALRLTREEGAGTRPFVDFFDAAPGERLLDTPFAIARVFRGMGFTRKYTLSATPVNPVPGRALTYHWVLIQGDADRVRILPREDDGRLADIEIDYQGPLFGTPFGVQSSRVDIALIADDGLYFSPPAFFSCFFLNNEVRRYSEDRRILSVDYGAAADNYVDPQISRRKDWRDLYAYGADGAPAGWTRLRAGREPVAYAAGGERIVKLSPDGEPLETAKPKYAQRNVETNDGPAPALVEE